MVLVNSNGNAISKSYLERKLHCLTRLRLRLKTPFITLNGANTLSLDCLVFGWNQKSKHLVYLTC